MSREDVARHYHVDESRMVDYVFSFPDQLDTAWGIAAGFVPPYQGPGTPLVICGMGGSAIGGKLLRDLAGRDGTAAIHLRQGYALPVWADTGTQVVCVSYSGNTEEVLSCFADALKRGCGVAVITSGGSLAAEADRSGVPCMRIPGGMPPRAALGFLFAPLLRFASAWGVLTVADEQVGIAVRRTRKLAKRYSLEADPAENTALQLAKRLYGKIPLIYSGDGLLAGVAYRWKCQFNENSKMMAFSNTFPELGHNEIMGWECPERFREDLFCIMLRDRDDPPRIRRRMDVTFEMLEALAGGAVVIESEGEAGRLERLTRLLSVLILGDFTSVYLAVEYGKDPTPIGRIDAIKEALRTEET